MGYQVKIPYTGDALKTYDRLTSDMKFYGTNTVYKHLEPDNPVYYYLSTKNYIHALMIRRNPYNKRLFQVGDYMLTKENKLKDTGFLTGDFPNIESIVVKLESMVNKNLKEW